MPLRCVRCLSIVLCLIVGSLSAQDPLQVPGPKKEHEWLKQFVGEWLTQSRGTMGPGQPPVESSGTLSSKMLGEFWVLNELKGDYEGFAMVGVQTIGYDAEKKKYVGTWIDSATAYMWKYEGTVDESGKILTLEAEGPNFMSDGKLTKFFDIYEFKSADEVAMTSRMFGTDGKWVTFMTGTATRVK